ncbi:MAG: family peptidase [Candidatus Peribacteria bacterium]|nr:family peptidase [Candidatus Peribacteria bacterium]
MFRRLTSLCIVFAGLLGFTQAAKAQVAAASQGFRFPVAGHNTSNIVQGMTFNTNPALRPNEWHTGWDIVSPNTVSNPPTIVASAYGRVWKIVYNSNNAAEHGEGNSVIVRHYIWDSYAFQYRYVFTQYSHMKSFAPGLAEGQKVQGGTPLGLMGSTADAKDPGTSRHLHFETKFDGVAGGELQNPWYYPTSNKKQWWGYSGTYHPNFYGWLSPDQTSAWTAFDR